MLHLGELTMGTFWIRALVATTLIGDLQSAKCQQLVKTPSLEVTIAFLNDSLTPQGDSVTSAHCVVGLYQSSEHLVATPEEFKVVKVDPNGMEHYGFTWHMFLVNPGFTQFDLKDIDPSSISSHGLASTKFIKEHDINDNPKALDRPDLSLVTFRARNSRQVVAHANIPEHTKDGLAGINLDRHSDEGSIVFESQDRAERFVTALKHAVELCGGTASDFAPTSSK